MVMGKKYNKNKLLKEKRKKEQTEVCVKALVAKKHSGDAPDSRPDLCVGCLTVALLPGRSRDGWAEGTGWVLGTCAQWRPHRSSLMETPDRVQCWDSVDQEGP